MGSEAVLLKVTWGSPAFFFECVRNLRVLRVSQSPPCWFGNLSFPDATCARPRSNNRPLGDKDCGCDPIRHTNDSCLGIHLRFLCLFRCCPCRTTAECGEGHEHGQTLCTQIPGASQLDGTTLQENASQQKGRLAFFAQPTSSCGSESNAEANLSPSMCVCLREQFPAQSAS